MNIDENRIQDLTALEDNWDPVSIKQKFPCFTVMQDEVGFYFIFTLWYKLMKQWVKYDKIRKIIHIYDRGW